jgi:anthranilate synthase component 2
MIFVIDNYDSFTFNLVQYLGELGAELRVARNDAVTVEEIAALAPAGLVISPGPGRPETSGIIVDAIRHLAGKVPILGVCLGHQAIGAAFGGRVVGAPTIMHGKTSAIHHDGRGVFTGLAQPFTATRYHSLVVSPDGLPDVLEVSARTADGVIMGLRHREHDVEGVQFHPESILTTEGKRLLANFLNRVPVHTGAGAAAPGRAEEDACRC